MLKAGSQLLEAKRPLQEVRDAFQEVKAAHTDLVAKHEAYTMFLNDEEYTEAETWMDDCTRNYIEFLMLVNDYTNDTDNPSPQLQDEESEGKQNEVEVHNVVSGEHENEGNKSAKMAEASAKPVVLKHEKPNCPLSTSTSRNTSFLEKILSMLSKNAAVPETLSQYYVPVLDQSLLS